MQTQQVKKSKPYNFEVVEITSQESSNRSHVIKLREIKQPKTQLPDELPQIQSHKREMTNPLEDRTNEENKQEKSMDIVRNLKVLAAGNRYQTTHKQSKVQLITNPVLRAQHQK